MTHSLRLSASATALGLALLAAPQARAQGFNANPVVITPGITIVRSPGVDTIRVGTAQGIINWINTDLPAPVIDFLPAGNSANFVNEGVADFVVLNRIQMRDPATVARFAGTVTSRLTTGGAPSPGGTLWFYSPGGILVANGAVFDVGSLLLTANQPVVFDTDGDGTPDSLFGPSGEIQLRSLRNDSRAAVVVEQNAQFSAPREGSYIAMVAPRIDMRGQVRVNGSAAYVAAEDLDITISAGLFDFSIIEGSFVDPTIAGDDETLRYAGATGGPSSTGAGDNHVTYLVAMPKNEAVTMLVTGSLGYDAASGAVVENGVIYLSAGGFSDQTTDIVRAPGQTISPASDPPGSIEISTVNVTSRLQAFATDSIFVRNGGSATSIYAEGAAFYAGNTITLLTESKGAHVFGGDALFAANNGVGGSFTFTGESDSTTDIDGNFLVDVGDNSEGGGAPALGGNLALALDVADLLVGGDIVLDARGVGVFINAVAEGRGGLITVDAQALSAISAANFTADATGIGAGTSGQAADGFGGQVTISADNSTIDVAGLARAVADGIGGNGGDVGAGDGIGGDVSLASLDGAAMTV
ncbi:MAG: hypothetical protein H7X93_09210, partial [Sphingomonadaceae bacterium]|nr:hypothetical protein [Sphingomonadaceae bacterium]